MEISSLDTSKFVFDPNSKTFVKDMQKEEPFLFDLKQTNPPVTIKSALTYICLMYDLNSRFLEKELDIIRRKEMIGKICGFPYSEKEGFSKYVIDLMSGKSEIFNDAIAHYLHLSNSIFLQRLASLEFNYEKLIRKSFDEYNSDLEKLTKIALDNIVDMRDKIYGGHESHELHKALSKKLRKISDSLRIEQINEEIKKDPDLLDYDPFAGYTPEKLRYHGDSV